MKASSEKAPARSSPPKDDITAVRRQIGTLVRLARREAGWTQEELGRAAGMSQGAIARIETGSRSVGIDRLIDIARALDVSVYDLLAP